MHRHELEAELTGISEPLNENKREKSGLTMSAKK
jgi:hypothetical protein